MLNFWRYSRLNFRDFTSYSTTIYCHSSGMHDCSISSAVSCSVFGSFITVCFVIVIICTIGCSWNSCCSTRWFLSNSSSWVFSDSSRWVFSDSSRRVCYSLAIGISFFVTVSFIIVIGCSWNSCSSTSWFLGNSTSWVFSDSSSRVCCGLTIGISFFVTISFIII